MTGRLCSVVRQMIDQANSMVGSVSGRSAATAGSFVSMKFAGSSASLAGSRLMSATAWAIPMLWPSVSSSRPRNSAARCHQPMNSGEVPAVGAHIQHRASVDFVVYNRVTNQPLLAIEVDGFAFHENSPDQRARDALKDESDFPSIPGVLVSERRIPDA